MSGYKQEISEEEMTALEARELRLRHKAVISALGEVTEAIKESKAERTLLPKLIQAINSLENDLTSKGVAAILAEPIAELKTTVECLTTAVEERNKPITFDVSYNENGRIKQITARRK